MFAYCMNNPAAYIDLDGETAESFLDLASGLLSLRDMMQDPSWKNAAFLLWDAGAAAVPFVPGSYVKRGADYIDEFSSILSSGVKYTDKVIKQMNDVSDIHHSFPSFVDSVIDMGSVWLKKGGDEKFRIEVKIPGAINGVEGFFEYLFELNGDCNHRFFR